MSPVKRPKLPFGKTVKRGILVDGIPTRNPPSIYPTLENSQGTLKQRILQRNPKFKALLKKAKK